MPQCSERDQQYQLPSGTFNVSESPPRFAKGNPFLRLLRSVRRHWVSVLGVWILIAVPSTSAIWYIVRPTYTASANVEVTPVPAAILYPGEIDPIGALESYLNTQAENILSGPVLRAALADPSLKGVPLLNAGDPVAEMKAVMIVRSMPRTNLLRVGIRQPAAGDAIRLTRAVMKAYEAYAGGNEAKAREEKVRILREEHERWTTERKRQQDAIAQLGEQYKATSQEMFTAMRENVLRAAVQTWTELERARIEQAHLKSQLKLLEQNLLPTSQPGEDQRWKEDIVDHDPTVKQLREEIGKERWHLLRYGESTLHRNLLTALERQLAQEKKRAAAEAALLVKERGGAMLEDEKRKVQGQLTNTNELVNSLEASYEAQKAEAQDMGRLAMQIQQLQNGAETTKKELDRIEDRLRQLDVEGRRPARISVNLEPEIPPDGIEDKRGKLTKLAVLGGLFLAMFVALLKDVASGRLYATEDIEDEMGLCLIGLLPALQDLRRGRISEEDFRESYRAIRATLAGRAPHRKAPNTLLVTSAQAAEGKTSFAVSLAASLAETGLRVLLVDGDVQAPRIGHTLKISYPYGLRHVLAGERTLTEAVGPTPIPNLDVLVSGRNGDSASGMLTNELASQVLAAANQHYDHVVIDSPPVLGSAEALIWAPSVEGVVLSCFAGRSNLRVLRRACERLTRAGGKILGTVVCNVSVHENYSFCSQYASTLRAPPEHREATKGPVRSREGPCIQVAGKLLAAPMPGKQRGES